MTTETLTATAELYNKLNKRYEKAYKNNRYKTSIVSQAIPLLPGLGRKGHQPRVLDVGCGTGIPVSRLLAESQLDVFGFDLSQEMVILADAQVAGTFTMDNMIEFQPQGTYAGVFIIFSQLHLSYSEFHAACWKLAQALEPDGLLVIGQTPADEYVQEKSEYDGGKAYYEKCDIPFFGEPCPTFAMTIEGQRTFLTSMGLEIQKEIIALFQPADPACDPEHQQYIIAKRPGDAVLEAPKPSPLE